MCINSTIQVLRYLKATLFHDLFINKESQVTLFTFSDSNEVRNPNDKTSSLACIVYLGSTPIIYNSKKQKIVAWSSTKAEYRAIVATISKIT